MSDALECWLDEPGCEAREALGLDGDSVVCGGELDWLRELARRWLLARDRWILPVDTADGYRFEGQGVLGFTGGRYDDIDAAYVGSGSLWLRGRDARLTKHAKTDRQAGSH